MSYEINQGFVVLYKKTNGDIGFISTASDTGYPYFEPSVRLANVHSKPANALNELNACKRNMKAYYGADKVDFSTLKVVRYISKFDEMDLDEASILFEGAKSKLTEEEYNAILIKNGLQK
jgi:hypothetical protein